jgi:hypothetical protein
MHEMNVYSVGDGASGILSGQVSRMPSALPQVPRYLVVHTVFWSSMHQWLSMKRSSQLAVPHEENSRSVVLTARSCSVHTLAFDLKCKQLAGKATPAHTRPYRRVLYAPPRHKVPSSADKTFPCPSRELHSRPSVAPLSRREQITSADYTRLG